MLAATAPTLSTIRPDDEAYETVRHTYSSLGEPAVLIGASTADEVRRAVAFAAEQGGALAVRSGGHGPSTNAGGVVLDLGGLRGSRVLEEGGRIVRVAPGSRWGEVARSLDAHDLAISSGDYGDVGVGGLATAGGIGLLARRQGLTIDRVKAAEVVLADGSLVRADEHQHQDLLWAVRGAGGGVGVVTALEIEAERVGDVTAAELTYETSDLAELLAAWASLVGSSERSLTSFLYLQAAPSGGALSARATVVDSSADEAAAHEAVARFADAAPLLEQRVSRVRYASLLRSERQPHRGQAAAMTTRAGLIDDLTRDGSEQIAALLTSGAAMVVQIRSVGGAVNDTDPSATAYAHRTQSLSVVAVAIRDRKPRLEAAWAEGIGRITTGTYLNLETERDEAVLRRAFPPETLARLHQVKGRYDPGGLFDASLPLPPFLRD